MAPVLPRRPGPLVRLLTAATFGLLALGPAAAGDDESLPCNALCRWWMTHAEADAPPVAPAATTPDTEAAGEPPRSSGPEDAHPPVAEPTRSSRRQRTWTKVASRSERQAMLPRRHRPDDPASEDWQAAMATEASGQARHHRWPRRIPAVTGHDLAHIPPLDRPVVPAAAATPAPAALPTHAPVATSALASGTMPAPVRGAAVGYPTAEPAPSDRVAAAAPAVGAAPLRPEAPSATPKPRLEPPPAAPNPAEDPDASRLVEAAYAAPLALDLPSRPPLAPSRATTMLLNVAGNVRSMGDLDGRTIATVDPDPGHRDRMLAELRRLRITLDLLFLPSHEAESRLHAGEIAAVASLADDETAGRAPADVLRIRLDATTSGHAPTP